MVFKNKISKKSPPPSFTSLLLAAAEMGCGLNKLEKRDDKRPGNIYSTLKRPQVETKIDVSYEYRFLEFTTLSAGEYSPLPPRVSGDGCAPPLAGSAAEAALSLQGGGRALTRTYSGGGQRGGLWETLKDWPAQRGLLTEIYIFV